MVTTSLGTSQAPQSHLPVPSPMGTAKAWLQPPLPLVTLLLSASCAHPPPVPLPQAPSEGTGMRKGTCERRGQSTLVSAGHGQLLAGTGPFPLPAAWILAFPLCLLPHTIPKCPLVPCTCRQRPSQPPGCASVGFSLGTASLPATACPRLCPIVGVGQPWPAHAWEAPAGDQKGQDQPQRGWGAPVCPYVCPTPCDPGLVVGTLCPGSGVFSGAGGVGDRGCRSKRPMTHVKR